jgi:hypothetical protein
MVLARTAAPATTATPTTPADPTVATPTTAPAPTAAPTITRLAVTSSTCSRFLLTVSFRVEGVTDRTTPQVRVATPWGVYATTATAGSSGPAAWSLAAVVPIALSPETTVTVTSGAQSTATTLSC